MAPNQTSSARFQTNVGRIRPHLARLADAQPGRLGQVARHALVPLLFDILRAGRGFDAHGGLDGGGDAGGLQRGLALRRRRERGGRVGVQVGLGTHRRWRYQKSGGEKHVMFSTKILREEIVQIIAHI